MKFVHTGDIHLGANPDSGKKSCDRKAELWDSFARLLLYCEREEVDLLLIAGDMFHRQPLLRELKEVNELFSRLTKTRVAFIAGNHDYVKRDSYYRSFSWAKNVYPFLSKSRECQEIKGLNLFVHGESYYEKEQITPMFKQPVTVSNKGIHFLLAHGGDAKHSPFEKRELATLPYEYVALGHIHKPDILLKNKVAYAGSLEPIDVNDIGERGFIKGEVVDGETRIEFVPFASRIYIELGIELDGIQTKRSLVDCIERQKEINGQHNMYKITLIGEKEQDVDYDFPYLQDYLELLSLQDETRMSYSMDLLLAANQENILGQYIQSFQGAVDSVEQLALYKGVEALVLTKKE